MCTGGDLFVPISGMTFDNVITERYASRLIRKILEAMNYLHAHHIIHRDLKVCI